MPLPTPDGQDEKEFISACMSDEYMKEKFPEQDQRLAVCYSQFGKASKTEVDLMSVMKAEADTTVVKANPYRSSNGRFTTPDMSVIGNSTNAAGAVKINEAIMSQIGVQYSPSVGAETGADSTSSQSSD